MGEVALIVVVETMALEVALIVVETTLEEKEEAMAEEGYLPRRSLFRRFLEVKLPRRLPFQEEVELPHRQCLQQPHQEEVETTAKEVEVELPHRPPFQEEVELP